MGRGFFVALACRPQTTPAAEALAARIEAELDWTSRCVIEGLRVWTGGAVALRVEARRGACLIGQVFERAGISRIEEDAPVDAGDAAAAARALSQSVWGRYVALFREPDGDLAAFRDPSGFVECLSWPIRPGVRLVTSDFCALPTWLRPFDLALNWDRLARLAGRPAACTTESLFDGVDAVAPGELAWLGRRRAELVWSPAAVLDGAADAAEVGRALVARVDEVTASLCAPHRRLLAEVSGGLDSSIVAASVAAAGLSGRVTQWLNRQGGRVEADEQVYAAAVCQALGAPLTTYPKPCTPLTEGDLREAAVAFRPSVTAVDVATDREVVERLQRTGSTAILSGQGGDAVFFQMPTSAVFADALRRAGLAALASPLLVNVARRTRKSVWTVLAEAGRELRNRPDASPVSALATPEARELAASAQHLWVRAARDQGAPPAKRLQIEAIANCHIYHDESRRARAADLLFPLLAQPVVELCLAIPAPVLAGGAFDRTFARAVFAERLPEVVRLRRDKGNMSAFFGRLIVASLGLLRPYLLDGALAQAGVLDRAKLARLLDPDVLIRDPMANELLWAAALEAWVRHWQGQVPDSAAAPRRA